MVELHTMIRISIALLLITLLGISSCRKDDEAPESGLDAYESSYDVIQGEIWDQSCISCHVAGSSFARQSDLILTAEVSYEQLINREPDNLAAREDGLLLVGDEGLESLYNSFLWEKINVLDQEHFYSDHPQYGSQMPLGGDPLTNGQLEFIRQWILAGAPKEGDFVDRNLLADDTRYTPDVTFEQPEIPEKGLQLHVGPFDVPGNTERELFYWEPLHNEEPLYIREFEIIMRPGSHHFILYNFQDNTPDYLKPKDQTLRDVYNSDGSYNIVTITTMQYHQFVAGTQIPQLRYAFPEGVALKVPANHGFDLNSHYANRTDDVIQGEVYANIYTIDESEVEKVAEILNLNNDDFRLPAGKVTTISKTYTFPETRYIFQLWSHAHVHNTEFKVFVSGGERDGELVYYSDDWEHPPILQLDPPLELGGGEGLKLEATYDNDEDRDLTFGLRSTDEMMILFGAYYK